MLRRSFVQKLKDIGDISVPEGHLRRNKGITTYFFDENKLPVLRQLLQDCGLEDKGQVKMYVPGTNLWEDPNRDCGLSLRRVFLNKHQSFVSLAILRWPA